MSRSGKPLRVVQLSDCHLFASTDGKLLGLNTEDSLEKVLELIEREQPAMDLILATGDLSQDASPASYERLIRKLARFPVPNYWLEGNHDITRPMVEALGSAQNMSPCVIHRGAWDIVMLDSSIPGEVPGELDPGDLEFLEQSLAGAAPGTHVMVCLHHHPIPLGCTWLDTQVVASADKFFDVIDRHDNVRAVVWGHVHQEYDGERKGVRLFAVPSTCVQFKPHSEDFAVDDTAPGYRWFDLYDDGNINTGVSRVVGIKFEVDFSVKGY